MTFDTPIVLLLAIAPVLWAAWEWPNHVTDKPLFQGTATIAMARQVYGIRNPENQQLALF